MGGVYAMQHIGITVDDISRTIAFYEIIGLRVVKQLQLDQEFLYSKNRVYEFKKDDNMTSQVVFMESLDGVKIEFFQFSKRKAYEKISWNKPGVTHLCFSTDNLHETYGKLVEAGAEILLEPVMGLTQEMFFVQDPDKNILEIGCPYTL